LLEPLAVGEDVLGAGRVAVSDEMIERCMASGRTVECFAEHLTTSTDSGERVRSPLSM